MHCISSHVALHAMNVYSTACLLAGCAMAVLAANTMFAIALGRTFWAVLIGAIVYIWTSKFENRAMFSACSLLGAYVYADRAAGSLASWVMHHMPWVSVGIQNQHFKGVIKVPAKVAEAVNEGGFNAWSRLTGLAVCPLDPCRDAL